MHLGLRQLLIGLFTGLIILCGTNTRAESEARTPSQSPAPMANESADEHTYPYSQISKDDSNTNNPQVDYRERRSTWGGLVSVGYSNFAPDDYRPDFVTGQTYQQFYGEADSPMIEGTFSAKLNFNFFSVTADAGVGSFQNNGRFGAILSLMPVRVGSTLALDGMFGEPYVVPYAFGGAYTVFYSEKLASQKVEGRTTPALYYGAGLKIQLDWIDPEASRDALTDFGLENTYVYLEARAFGISGDRVPDVSSPGDTPLMYDMGLSFEF